jgi:urocanate hydratase
VADFLVNSLDEALRILKNEIRKHETVAVCIAAAPLAIENEMRERGVVPDLLAPGFAGNPVLASERRRLAIRSKDLTQALLCWSVASTPARWLPKLDTIALGCLASGSEPQATSRWLRLAPRYLGRLAQGIRILRCSRKIGDAFATQVQTAIRQGEIGVAVKIDFNGTAVS